MKIFNLLVIIAVALAIIFFITTMFIIPEKDVYEDLIKGVKSAYTTPGEPFDFEFSANSGTTINRLAIEESSELSMLNDLHVNITAHINGAIKNQDTLSLSKNVFREDSYIVCNPSIKYANDTRVESGIYCDIVFGESSHSLGNIDIISSNKEVNMGFVLRELLVSNLNSNEQIDVFVFENIPSFNEMSLYDLSESDAYRAYSTKALKTTSIQIDFEDQGKFLVVYMLTDGSLISNYAYETLEVKNTFENELSGCTPQDITYSHYNYEKEVCVYNLNCIDCSLPSHCKEIWIREGYNAISSTKDSAKYENGQECLN